MLKGAKKRKEKREVFIVWSFGLFLSEIMRCGNSEAKVPTSDRKSKWELKNENGLLTSQCYILNLNGARLVLLCSFSPKVFPGTQKPI